MWNGDQNEIQSVQMLKSMHKWKFNKFYGGKLTCGCCGGPRNEEKVSRRRGTMVVCVAAL